MCAIHPKAKYRRRTCNHRRAKHCTNHPKSSPKNPMYRIPHATPRQRGKDCQVQGRRGSMCNTCKCEQREQTRDNKFFQKPRLSHNPGPCTCRCTTTGVTKPRNTRRRCMVTWTYPQPRHTSSIVSKTSWVARLTLRPSGRNHQASSHPPSSNKSPTVPVVGPFVGDDHDPGVVKGTPRHRDAAEEPAWMS